MNADRPAIHSLPELLQPPVSNAWQDYLDNAAAQQLPTLTDPELLAEVPTVWAASNFVAVNLSRHPALLQELADGPLRQRYHPGELRSVVADSLAGVSDEANLGRRLRLIRRREMVRITWRDITARATLDETLLDLSELAEACVDLALARLYDWLCVKFGTPCNADGEPQRMVVLGMGKLGGHELNFSSDIDLIFAYPEPGETRDGPRALDNAQFFLRLGRQLIKALDEVTADGFVYRTDMRLRPNGSVGPLAISFDAMESYYQLQGRAWERYAMVKARVVGGDYQRGEELLAMLRPFVYRRYLDFGAIESLRELKETIRAEMRRKGMEENIKLGGGGIREVEFVVQAHQIIHGGRNPALQQRHLLGVLQTLGQTKLLPEHTVSQLDQAYRFLRQLENRIQQVDDRQLQQLPDSELDRARLVLGMNQPDWETLKATLDQQRQWVENAFEQVFSAPQRDDAEQDAEDSVQTLWRQLDSHADEDIIRLLDAAGFEGPAEMCRQLRALHQHRIFKAMSSNGRQRLDQLMPLAIGAAAGSPHPDATLERLLTIIESIGRRSAYLGLLVENPMALGQLARLCSASAWIAERIARHPLLLDELIDPRTLFAPPRKAGLQAELAQMSAALEPTDLEAQMETLRRFQITNQLRIAAADVVGALPLMVVSDHLTELAEVSLDGALRAGWAQMTAKHGRPPCELDEQPEADGCITGFAVIGYGKLGGIEFSYGSDLDIIFLHAGTQTGVTDGDKPIDSGVFYSRLVQRIVHIISTPTAAGRLYETDLRLRPSGASGLMVTSISAMQTYQQEQAWTWEHQALVRARPVAGDPAVGAAFEQIRSKVLSQPRDPQALRTEVREMREKMREHLGSRDPGRFHIKQDHGGVADIEFLVQYGVLRWAAEHPALIEWTDNIRLLDSLRAAGLLSAERSESLADAYREFRREIHRLTLAGLPAVVDNDAFEQQRAIVTEQWREWLEE